MTYTDEMEVRQTAERVIGVVPTWVLVLWWKDRWSL